MRNSTSRTVAVIDDIKADMGCQLCSVKDVDILALHCPGKRDFNPEIPQGFCGKTPEEVGAELEKHVVLCLNCRGLVKAGKLECDPEKHIVMQEVDYRCLPLPRPRQ